MSVYSNSCKVYKKVLVDNLDHFGIDFDVESDLNLIILNNHKKENNDLIILGITNALSSALEQINIKGVQIGVEFGHQQYNEKITTVTPIFDGSSKRFLIHYNQDTMNYIDLERVAEMITTIHKAFHNLGENQWQPPQDIMGLNKP